LQLADVYNVYSVDLLEREEMAVLNAIPTAEGAIQIAMEEMKDTCKNAPWNWKQRVCRGQKIFRPGLD